MPLAASCVSTHPTTSNTAGPSLFETPVYTCKRPKRSQTQEPCSDASTDQGPPSPQTPGGSTAAPSSAQAQWYSQVYLQLMQWLSELQALYPVCALIPTEVTVLALGVFRQYVLATGFSSQYFRMQPLIAHAVLGVCLWAAIKFLAAPGVVPNAQHLTRIFGVPNKMLVALEPEVLRLIGWDVYAICKEIGLQRSPELEAEELSA